ncbi:MAG: DUF3592 domain-containing protein [Candidatus Obscuribacterales bacterium]|nr:DUF3592 domain-containing protein [Candidatus Obscuribacterales bacterium]
MYSKSEPLQSVSRRDSPYRIAAVIAVFFAIVSGYLEFRCHNLSQWIEKQAEVVSTRVVKLDSVLVNNLPPDYSISARLKYTTPTSGDHFVERIVKSHMSNYDADVAATNLVGTKVPVRYDPQNVDDCLLEESAAQTNFIMPLMPYIFVVCVVAAVSCVFLTMRVGKN